MQLKGLHLEYIVTGAISMLWFTQISKFISNISAFPEIPISHSMLLIIFIPCLYIIGLLIDYSMHNILGPIRNKIKKSSFANSSIIELTAYQRMGKLLKQNQEAINRLEIRKTRDRISRGLLFNIVAFGVVYTVLIFANRDWYSLIILDVIVLFSSFYVFNMWKYFRRRFYEFERKLLEQN
jgi:hypothetical protein